MPDLTGHICLLPAAGPKLWWDCSVCGQIWHRDTTRDHWKLTPREPQNA